MTGPAARPLRLVVLAEEVDRLTARLLAARSRGDYAEGDRLVIALASAATLYARALGVEASR